MITVLMKIVENQLSETEKSPLKLMLILASPPIVLLISSLYLGTVCILLANYETNKQKFQSFEISYERMIDLPGQHTKSFKTPL